MCSTYSAAQCNIFDHAMHSLCAFSSLFSVTTSFVPAFTLANLSASYNMFNPAFGSATPLDKHGFQKYTLLQCEQQHGTHCDLCLLPLLVLAFYQTLFCIATTFSWSIFPWFFARSWQSLCFVNFNLAPLPVSRNTINQKFEAMFFCLEARLHVWADHLFCNF